MPELKAGANVALRLEGDDLFIDAVGGGGEAPSQPLTKGMVYTLSPSPSASIPDSGGELTDGVFPVTSAPNFAGYVGWQDQDSASITFDFEQETRIDAARVWGLVQTSQGVYVPASVALESSPDGSAWTSRGSVSPGAVSVNPGNWLAAIECTTDLPFRYWRVVVTRTGTNQWFLLGEVEMYGS